MSEPILDARVDDDQFDLTLRPRLLTEYVGQEQVRENRSILLEAARRLEQDAQVLADLLLADVLGEQPWAEREVELVVVHPGVEDRLAHFRPSALRAPASASCVFGVDFQSTDSMPARAS